MTLCVFCVPCLCYDGANTACVHPFFFSFFALHFLVCRYSRLHFSAECVESCHVKDGLLDTYAYVCACGMCVCLSMCCSHRCVCMCMCPLCFLVSLFCGLSMNARHNQRSKCERLSACVSPGVVHVF